MSSNQNAPPPETPTESMEFLARSWRLSAVQISKALSNDHQSDQSTKVAKESLIVVPSGASPPVSPRDSEELKELLLLHQTLNPEFLSYEQCLRNGLYKCLVRKRTIGRRLKDQKEKKKQEIRTHNAEIHAAVSVAGVAAAVAAITSSTAMSAINERTRAKTAAAIASASALVATHCIEIVEDMGAEQNQIITVVNSAISAKANGDIMALTAGAATALRGAAILRLRLEKTYGMSNFSLVEQKGGDHKEPNTLTALNFVSRGGELLKRTRKGVLHWKQVSFDINSHFQVVAKMKSKYMAGTFTKKKKCVVNGVCCDIQAWSGRVRQDINEEKAYFGIKTVERIIEFECKTKSDKQRWIDGIEQLMKCYASMI